MRSNAPAAFIDCNDCRKYLYDLKTGKRDTYKGKDVLLSVIHSKPHCEIPNGPGCPKGHWSNPKTLNRRNMMALIHYQECKAVGQFPADSVVRHNARIIMLAEKSHEQDQGGMAGMLLAAMFGGGSR